MYQQLDGVVDRLLPRRHRCIRHGTRESEFSNNKYVIILFLLSIVLLLQIYNHQTTSTTVVVAFGYYYRHSSASATPSSQRRGTVGDRYNIINSYQSRRQRRKNAASNLILMMIFHKDHHQNGGDDDDDNEYVEKNKSSLTATFVQRKWIESSTLRPKNLFTAVTTRFQKTALKMFDKRINSIGISYSSPSSMLVLSGMSSSTSSTTSTEPLIAATPPSSTQKQIAEHVAKVNSEIDNVNQISAFENEIVHQEISATSTSSAPIPIPSSVHLQLTDPTLSRQESKTNSEMDVASQTDSTITISSKPTFATTTVIVHSYTDSKTNQTWKALNISRRKFRSYLQYCDVWNNDTSTSDTMTINFNTTSHGSDNYAGIETLHHSILSTSSKSKPEATTNHSSAMSDSQIQQGMQNVDQLRNFTSHLRDEWRSLWKMGRLITDRTELLAVYPSDLKPDTMSNDDVVEQGDAGDTSQLAATSKEKQDHQSKPIVRKRGGFADLLMLYTDRLMAILSDEHEDDGNNSKSASRTQSMDIVKWLENNYGRSETRDLKFENFQTFDESTKLIKLKHFLEWFRSQFPYFYDRCDTCGASIKEDLANFSAASVAGDTSPATASGEVTSNDIDDANVNLATTDESNNDIDDTDTSAETESEHQTFVGYVYPNSTELTGKASRTELYQCHQCASFTRFPRYNAAQFVMTQKRGRCGEYSMLLYRFVRALHHECRWVVDWADHVWVELLLQSSNHDDNRWIHLDPCEAAVNENFIYQGWGKKQNYILGFYLPTIYNMKESLQHLHDSQQQPRSNRAITTLSNISYIEDITHCYTSEEWSDVCQRRDESEAHIQESIVKATNELQQKLLEYYNFTAATSNATNNTGR